MKRRDGVYLGLLGWLCTAMLAIFLFETAVTRQDYLSNNLALGNTPQSLITLLGIWTAATVYLCLELSKYLRSKSQPEKAVWLPVAVVLTTVAAAFAYVKPIAASDPRYYVAFGRQIVALGVNPYTTLIRESLGDPIVSLVTPMWIDNPCQYGPLSLIPFALGNLLSPQTEFFAICSTIRLLYLPMFVLLGVLFYRAWGWSRYAFALCVAVMANPLFLQLGLNSAHPEIWVLFFLLIVCLVMNKEKPVLTALVFSAACSTKIVPIVLIPPFLCWWYRKSPRQAAIFFAVFAVVHGTIYTLLDGADYPAVIQNQDRWINIRVTSGPVVRAFLALSFPPAEASRLGLYAFFVAGGAFCWAILRRKKLIDPYTITAVTLAILFFFRTYCNYWYTLWFWPFLWLAYRKERNAAISIASWTVLMLLGHGLGWAPRVWLYTAVFAHNLWLLWKEQTSLASSE